MRTPPLLLALALTACTTQPQPAAAPAAVAPQPAPPLAQAAPAASPVGTWEMTHDGEPLPFDPGTTTLILHADGLLQLYRPEHCNLQLVSNDWYEMRARWRPGEADEVVLPLTYGLGEGVASRFRLVGDELLPVEEHAFCVKFYKSEDDPDPKIEHYHLPRFVRVNAKTAFTPAIPPHTSTVILGLEEVETAGELDALLEGRLLEDDRTAREAHWNRDDPEPSELSTRWLVRGWSGLQARQPEAADRFLRALRAKADEGPLYAPVRLELQ